MPEILSDCRRRAERFEEMEKLIVSKFQKKEKICCDREYDTTPGEEVTAMIPAAGRKKGRRAKESSRFFGVRFRPDLSKWVAEIRVAQWKSVDKKVWLGTFDSEDGAARAVDAARKLLKCQKKRPPNFACAALQEYNESIPASLLLDNVYDGSMFKTVTAFVKLKAKEYAASFGPSTTAAMISSPCLSDQLSFVSHPSKIQVGNGSRGFQLASTMEPHQLYPLPESDVSPSSYSPSSYGSYGTQLLSGGAYHAWGSSSSSVTYSGPPSCSSAGTSPGNNESWVLVGQNMSDMSMSHTAIGACGNWAMQDLLLEDQMPMGIDDQTSIYMDDSYQHDLDESFFTMDDVVQDPCHTHVQSFTNISPDEVLNMDSNNSWMMQSYNNNYTSFSNSLGLVC